MEDNLRRERYPSSRNELPFVLYDALERTPHNCSNAQNWHEEIEIELCTEGRGEVLLGGKYFDFEPGDIIIVNSDVLHHTGSKHRVVYTCLIPRIDFCRAVGFEPRKLHFCEKIRDARVEALIKELTAGYSASTDIGAKLRLCEKLLQLLSIIANEYSTDRAKADDDVHMLHVRVAIEFIHINYTKKFTLDQIARSIFIDKYTLCREFKRATGQTVVEYANSYRVQKAARLISSGRNVAEAAHECGFENLSFFTRTFKKYMGILPSSFKGAEVK